MPFNKLLAKTLYQLLLMPVKIPSNFIQPVFIQMLLVHPLNLTTEFLLLDGELIHLHLTGSLRILGEQPGDKKDISG